MKRLIINKIPEFKCDKKECDLKAEFMILTNSTEVGKQLRFCSEHTKEYSDRWITDNESKEG